MKKFFIKTMGCKSNQLEGSLIEENLLKNGYITAERASDADIFILNSCSVTHKSDNEAFNILSHVKRDNPCVKTILTGCIAQIEKEKLLENPNVDFVLGNDEKLSISEFLDKNLKIFVGNIMQLNEFHSVLLENTKKTRASLKIQDGCDNRCSYCVIPFARGKNRSADLEFILNQIKVYENMGFKEIVLTGIHIGQWGLDLSDYTLLDLLKNIENKTNISRFRLGSLNPLEIGDEMLVFLKNSEKFCPHFHLSLQSMCDETLKAMNRHYSVKQAFDLIEKIDGTFDLPFIGSDIIAGFVGESQEDFEITVENLKKSKLTQIHTFPYSVRKGTLAEKLSGHVEQKIKDNRAKIIKEISSAKHGEFLKKNLGTIQELLVEKNIDKKSGYFKGVTRNYVNVLIEPSVDFGLIRNTIQKVKITDVGEKVFSKLF